MSYDASIGTALFTRLGVYVGWWYELDAVKATLDGVLDNAIDAFNIKNAGASTDAPTEADKTAYGLISAEVRRQQDAIESLRHGVASLAGTFFGVNGKELLDAPYESATDVLDLLIDQMDDAGHKVEANVVSATSAAEDEDNSVLASDLLDLPDMGAPTQRAQRDCFSLVCADDATVDAEQWTLLSGRLGAFSGSLVTGTTADWEAAGLAGLIVHPAPAHDESGDTAAVGKVGGWTLSGAVRGGNVSADGRVWLRFNAKKTFAVEGDDLSQISWTPANLVFGADADVDGKVHVSVMKDPAGCEVLGGVRATLDPSGIIIDGAGPDNTHSGTLYAKVTQEINSDESRDYTVQLYSDATRQTLEASGTVTQIAVGDLPVTVDLTAQSGGVSGQVVLESFSSTQDGATDATILIRVPRYVARAYRSSARSEGDLVAEAISYEPSTGSVDADLNRVGVSGNIGSVGLNYIQDNAGIVVTPEFYTLDLFKADPDDSATGDDSIVARAGSLANLLTGSVQANLPLGAVNGSGLVDANVDLTADTVAAGDVVSVVVGYAKGDTFGFTSDWTDTGRFQTFLRDSFDRVFPAGTGSDVTFSDLLAGE